MRCLINAIVNNFINYKHILINDNTNVIKTSAATQTLGFVCECYNTYDFCAFYTWSLLIQGVITTNFKLKDG